MIEPNADETLALSPLDLEPDATQADRVVRQAMARIAALETRNAGAVVGSSVLGDVAAWWNLALAATALIAVAAGATLTLISPQSPVVDAQIESQLLDWASTGYTPNNAELVAAFSWIAR